LIQDTTEGKKTLILQTGLRESKRVLTFASGHFRVFVDSFRKTNSNKKDSMFFNNRNNTQKSTSSFQNRAIKSIGETMALWDNLSCFKILRRETIILNLTWIRLADKESKF